MHESSVAHGLKFISIADAVSYLRNLRIVCDQRAYLPRAFDTWHTSLSIEDIFGALSYVYFDIVYI